MEDADSQLEYEELISQAHIAKIHMHLFSTTMIHHLVNKKSTKDGSKVKAELEKDVIRMDIVNIKHMITGGSVISCVQIQ